MRGRMRRFPGWRVRWVLPLLAILALSACPYSSEHPLSDPGAAAWDPALAGTWKLQDPETREWVTLSFFRYDEHGLVAFTPGDAGGKADAYRMFVTVIEGEKFLNVRQLDEKADQGWFFVNYRIEGSRLVLRVVEEELFGTTPFATSQALRSFVQRNLADPRLYSAGDTDRPSGMIWQRAET
jgi:hypothetical protein